jgi:hypothetical protein
MIDRARDIVRAEQTTDVIPVIVRENDFLHIRQMDVWIMCIPDHGIRVSAGIHEHTMAIHIDQGSETPSPMPAVSPTSIVDRIVILNR